MKSMKVFNNVGNSFKRNIQPLCSGSQASTIVSQISLLENVEKFWDIEKSWHMQNHAKYYQINRFFFNTYKNVNNTVQNKKKYIENFAIKVQKSYVIS